MGSDNLFFPIGFLEQELHARKGAFTLGLAVLYPRVLSHFAVHLYHEERA